MTYYKFMQEGCRDPLTQTQWQPGKWMPAVEGEYVVEKGEGKIIGNLYHFCRALPLDLMIGTDAELYEFAVEPGGEVVEYCYGCFTTARCRITRRVKTWNKKVMRNLVCDYAERVLPVFEKQYPDNPHLRQALEATRKFVNGQVTKRGVVDAWTMAFRGDWEDANGPNKAVAVVWHTLYGLLQSKSNWTRRDDYDQGALQFMFLGTATDAAMVVAGMPNWSSGAEWEWQGQRLLEALGIEPYT